MANLISEISKLSIYERIQLVQEILATISQDAVKQNDFELTDVQIQEIESRSASIAEGTAKTTPWKKIEAFLMERYGL